MADGLRMKGRRGGGRAGRGLEYDDVDMFRRLLVRVTNEALMDLWRQCVTGMGISALDEESPGWRAGAEASAVNHTAFLRASEDMAKRAVPHERMQNLMVDLGNRVRKMRRASPEDIQRMFIEPLTTLQRPTVDKYKMFMEAEARRRNRKGVVMGATFTEFIRALLAHLSITPELQSCAYFFDDKLDRPDLLTRVITEAAQNSIVILPSTDRFGEHAARRAGVRISDRDRALRSVARNVFISFEDSAASEAAPPPSPATPLEWGGGEGGSVKSRSSSAASDRTAVASLAPSGGAAAKTYIVDDGVAEAAPAPPPMLPPAPTPESVSVPEPEPAPESLTIAP